MIVRVVDDVTLEILWDGTPANKMKGHFISQPNSCRRDIKLRYTPPFEMKTFNKRFRLAPQVEEQEAA